MRCTNASDHESFRMARRPAGPPKARRLVGACTALVLLAGCANKPPARFVDGVPWVAEHHQVRDAKTQRVKGYPCLRMDVALLDRLDAAIHNPDLAQARADALTLIDDAHGLALRSANNEMQRLDEQGWRELSKVYFASEVPPTDLAKQQMGEEFRHQTDTQVWFLKQEIEAAADLATLQKVLQRLRAATEESIKDGGGLSRAGAMAVFALPAKVAQSSIHSKEAGCYSDSRFEGRRVYDPDTASSEHPSGLPADDPELRHWDLLMKHAPRLVMEHRSAVKYAPEADRIGRVKLRDEQGRVEVDVALPTVYAYSRTVLLNGRPHVQLTYAFWYPEHPAVKGSMDPEAGPIDGTTIRLTLDANGNPATFETLSSCGCHHRLYPMRALEEAAAREYGGSLPAKLYAIQADVGDKYDLIVPKLIDAPAAPQRPLVRCLAGSHAVVDIDYADRRIEQEPEVERNSYVLLPYLELEQLHTPGGKVMSMFLDNGLVRGADRLESALLSPLGMLNAGQPRQRGTQLIHWDQYDFDSPRLLEKTLRLPKEF